MSKKNNTKSRRKYIQQYLKNKNDTFFAVCMTKNEREKMNSLLKKKKMTRRGLLEYGYKRLLEQQPDDIQEKYSYEVDNED